MVDKDPTKSKTLSYKSISEKRSFIKVNGNTSLVSFFRKKKCYKNKSED